MPCYNPITGYRAREKNPSGKYSLVFNPNHGYRDMPVQIPCGRCIGCRLEKSRQWAIRCVHEASLYEDNCFITLTYNEENLPTDKSLKKRDFQLFMKRLRKAYPEKRIRFFHCGEYGEKYKRPHYHAILFNYVPEDKERIKINLWKSEKLSKIWGKGFVSVGEVTFESCAYVARYITKKVTGSDAHLHYDEVNYETGEINSRVPEYTLCSRRGGIGSDWFERYKSDVYSKDYIVLRNKKMKSPKFYDLKFEKENPKLWKKIKYRRNLIAKSREEDNTIERLFVKEQIKLIKFNELKRSYEHET